MNVSIVPVAEEHAESFREALDLVARERRYIASTTAPSLENVRDFLRRSVASDAAHFLALDGTRVVGGCDILSGDRETLRHRGELGMFVVPEWRGKGIGERLLTACLAKAKTNGITRVELEVRADNEPAIRLYRRVGFQDECVKRQGLRFDGIYYDTICMYLLTGDAVGVPSPGESPAQS